jgi:hypothetical protein
MSSASVFEQTSAGVSECSRDKDLLHSAQGALESVRLAEAKPGTPER